jgi:hypothetical protein
MRMPRQISALEGYPYFYHDTKNFFVEATNFMMTGKEIDLLCSYLASSLGFYVFTKFYTGPQFDETGFRYKKVYLLDLLVPTISANYQEMIKSEFSKLENSFLFLESSVTINRLWYAAVGLDGDEIAVVDSYKSDILKNCQSFSE